MNFMSLWFEFLCEHRNGFVLILWLKRSGESYARGGLIHEIIR